MSHNNMQTFFSGTDTSTLLKEGIDTNHFVSLIVNNEGTYSAGITRKVLSEYSMDISTVKSYYSYNNKLITEKPILTKKEAKSEEIQWYSLDIDKEEVEEPSQTELGNRLMDLKKAKDTFKSSHITYPSTTDTYTPNWQKKDYNYNDTTFPEGKKWEANSTEDSGNFYDYLGKKPVETKIIPLNLNQKIIPTDYAENLVRQVISGWVFSTATNKSLKDFSALMTAKYTKRFNTLEEFNDWAFSHVDYLMDTAYDDELIAKGFTEDEMTAQTAKSLIFILMKLPINEYLKIFISLIKEYDYTCE